MSTQSNNREPSAILERPYWEKNDEEEEEMDTIRIPSKDQLESVRTNGTRDSIDHENHGNFQHHSYAPLQSPMDVSGLEIPVQSPTGSSQAEVPETGMPIRLHIRTKKLLLYSFLIIAFILLVDIFFYYGLVLKRMDLNEKAEKEAKENVENYNTYTGTITAVFLKLIESQTTMLVSTVFFTVTNAQLLGDFTIPSYVLPGFLAVLSTGFSALNVQKESGIKTPIIVDRDIFFFNWKNFNSEETTVSDNTKSLNEPTGAWNLAETVLRTTFLSSDPTVMTDCSFYSVKPNDRFVQYYFNTYTWFQDMLPQGVSNDEMTKFTIALTNTTAPLPNGTEVELIERSDDLSSFEVESLVSLVYDTFRLSNDVLNWSAVSSDTATNFQQDVHDIIDGKNDFWSWTEDKVNIYLEQLNTENQLNIDIPQTAVVFKQFNISDNIKFESVTLELYLNFINVTEEDGGVDYSVDTREYCGEYICLLKQSTNEDDPSRFQAAQPQIHAFSSCPFFSTSGTDKCNYQDNEIIIYSYGTRIEADDMTLSGGISEIDGLNTTIATYTGIKRISTITVGRLSWELEDLSAKFSAQCNTTTESKCEGLSFELSSNSIFESLLASSSGSSSENAAKDAVEAAKEANKIKRFAIVGRDYINLGTLGPNTNLTPLMKIIQTDGSEPIFRWNVNQAKDWQVPYQYCSMTVDMLAKRSAANRLFVQYGYQNAYTAGLFFLFQNAVEKAEVELKDDKKTLQFIASKKFLHLEAKIPPLAAIQTGVACILLFLGTLYVVLYGKTHSTGLKKDHLSPHDTAKLMLSKTEYPETYVEAKIDLTKSRPLLNTKDDASLDDFEISTLTLKRRRNLSRDDGSRKSEMNLV